jgi:hypothetical protein
LPGIRIAWKFFIQKFPANRLPPPKIFHLGAVIHILFFFALFLCFSKRKREYLQNLKQIDALTLPDSSDSGGFPRESPVQCVFYLLYPIRPLIEKSRPGKGHGAPRPGREESFL